jgi:hypothetical protein
MNFSRSEKMPISGIKKVFVFVGLMLAVCGCSRPNLTGSDATVYSRGQLYALADQDLNSVYSATIAALQQLDLEVTEKARDAFYAKVIGKVADGTTITIPMEPVTDNTTNLSIKVSKFLSGNEDRARTIYEKIKQNL